MVGHLMRAYGADGLKIDMIDVLRGPENHRCTADHEHDIESYGVAMHALLKEIHDAVKAVRPDALIEFRMNYSNLVTRSFATSHRAQDAPYDFDHIRRMCTRLKSYMINPELGESGNVAVHTDPAYWMPQESPENVARFMSSLVTSGVPMLSMDLRSLPEEHGRIVRAWLSFFRQHRDLLLFGAHRALSADPHYSIFSVHREEQVLWGIFTGYLPGELQVPGKGIRQMWMLNGSAQSQLFARLLGVEGEDYTARIYERELELKREEQLAVEEGSLLLDVEVEPGGAIEITVTRNSSRTETVRGHS
jgi:alpha-galactosidase